MEAVVLEKSKKVSVDKSNKKVNSFDITRMSYKLYDHSAFEYGFKYEWKNGFAVKNGTSIKSKEMYIATS